MKNTIITSLFILAVSSFSFSFSQEQKSASSSEFTKAELLAFADVKALLSAINQGKDYSKYAVRNFVLSTTVTNPDGTHTKVFENGPGGIWSEAQKTMIEKYAKKGTDFTLERIIMFEGGKKGTVNSPSVPFSIKE